VVNELSDNVSGYSVEADGALKPLPGSPFSAGLSPFSVAVSATPSFAYVANKFGESVSVYRIGSNGSLVPVAGSPFAAGAQPCCVIVGSGGRGER
jgi:DNA-binding beta-propeller fold protein YncE